MIWFVIWASLIEAMEANTQCLQSESPLQIEDHFSHMNLNILYEEKYKSLLPIIDCYLGSKFKTTNYNILPNPDGTIQPVCNNTQFVRNTKIIGKVNVMITISSLNDIQLMEEHCDVSANILHLKISDSFRLGHILTPRSDLIVPIERENDGILHVLDLLLAACGPVKYSADAAIYKSLSKHSSNPQNASSIVPFVVGCIVVACTVLAVAGLLIKTRQSRRKSRSSVIKKTNLLAQRTQEGTKDEMENSEPEWAIEEDDVCSGKHPNLYNRVAKERSTTLNSPAASAAMAPDPSPLPSPVSSSPAPSNSFPYSPPWNLTEKSLRVHNPTSKFELSKNGSQIKVGSASIADQITT